MIVAVLCYLAAFTALCIDYLDYSELIWNVEMESVATSNMCKPLKWDYVSEFLFHGTMKKKKINTKYGAIR